MFFRWFAAVCVCVVLQSTLVPSIGIAGIRPDLPLIILVVLSLRTGVIAGAVAGFFLGLGLDLYSPSLLGQSALAMTVTGAFAGLFNERVMRIDPLVKVLVLVVAFLVHDILFFAVNTVKIDAPKTGFLMEILTRSLPRIAYSIFVAALYQGYETFVRPSLRR